MKDIIKAVEQHFFTKSQAEIYTGLSARSLDYAKEKGELEFFKFGKRVLFKRSDLDTWLEKHRVGANLDRIVSETVAEVLGK